MSGGICGSWGMRGGGGAWQGGACVVGKTAIAAGSTHPTGMHSFFHARKALAVSVLFFVFECHFLSTLGDLSCGFNILILSRE